MTIPEFLLLILILFVIGCLIIWFIYGSFRAGRQMGGVYILYAPPGEGKSYVATHLILEYLRKERDTYSNFPVISPDMKLVSRVWNKKLMKENIFDSAIFIDESYKDFNSREYKTFTKDDHDWFATSGHNQNSIWLLTQNPQRIDVVIREVANFYVAVEKVEIPLLEIPIYFWLYYYRSEEEMRVSKYGFAEPWDTQRIWFNWFTASSYDTRFFRKPTDTLYHGKTWFEIFAEKNFEYKPPVPSGIAFLKMAIYRGMDKLVVRMKAIHIPTYGDIGARLDRSLEKEEEQEDLNHISEELFEDDSR